VKGKSYSGALQIGLLLLLLKRKREKMEKEKGEGPVEFRSVLFRILTTATLMIFSPDGLSCHLACSMQDVWADV